MKEIQLTQGKVALVDDEDFDYLNQFKWCAGKYSSKWYAVRRVNKKNVFMHHVLLTVPKGQIVDHKNTNGLDNRRENLRECTYQQNNQNSSKKGKTSSRKGIYWNTEKGKWQAQIVVDGKRLYLGRRDNEIEASKLYDESALKYFGEFARTNMMIKGATSE